MEKGKRIKKIMAILAIFLFIGPIFLVAIANYSSYYSSKHQEDTTAETAEQTNNDAETSEDKDESTNDSEE